MAILVPRWLDFSWQVRLQMCLRFCMVQIANQCSMFFIESVLAQIPSLTAARVSKVVEIVLCVWALVRFATFTIQNFRHICSRTCQLKSSHLGTKIAITFTIFGFRRRFLSQIV